MIDVCIKPGCINPAKTNEKLCEFCIARAPINDRVTALAAETDRRAEVKPAEFTGGNVNYYLVSIESPKRLDAYTAECEDIISALGMTFAEGCAFKAIWRSCAQRTLGHMKRGQDKHGIYDAEKVQYYGGIMLADRQRAAERDRSHMADQLTPADVSKTFELEADKLTVNGKAL